MTALIDITHQRFGRLTALSVAGRYAKDGQVQWLCRCDCGNTSTINGAILRSGHTRSCGCEKGFFAHGHARRGGETGAYKSWKAMMARCNNPAHSRSRYYSERGITVCERWFDFANFYADMGDRPKGKSIDRIDNSKGYEPSNCRWATQQEQILNRG
jgi:hypothetical protein